MPPAKVRTIVRGPAPDTDTDGTTGPPADQESGQFDAAFYLATYTDVAGSELDPLLHYVNAATVKAGSPTATSGPMPT